MAALLGSAGQATYSAANSGLDALAASARHNGRPVTAVQWGPWAGAGMAAGAAAARTRLQRLGLGMLTARQGLKALERVLAGSSVASAVQAVIAADWPTVAGRLQPEARAIFSGLSGAAELAAPRGSASAADRHQAFTAAVGVERLADVTERVAAAVEAVTGRSLGHAEPLMASGLDSLGAMELLSALEVDAHASVAPQADGMSAQSLTQPCHSRRLGRTPG